MQKETCVYKTGQVIGVILGRTELLAFEMEENFEHNEKKYAFRFIFYLGTMME